MATKDLNWLECTFDQACLMQLLAPVFEEWAVQLLILLPVYLLLFRFVLHALLSMGIPVPFATERMKQFISYKPQLGYGDQQAMNALRKHGQDEKTLMNTAETWLIKWYGKTTFSLQAYQRSLSIAVFYPLVLLIFIWVCTGVGELNSFELLPTIAAWKRWGIAIMLVLYGYGLYFAFNSKKKMGCSIKSSYW